MNTQHHATDDMAGLVGPDDRFITNEGGYRLDTRRPFIPQGRQEATVQPQPAEAATEVGADDDVRRPSGAIAWPVWVVVAFLLVAACWNLSELLV